MSNFLAVATVTETLRQLLDSTVAADVPGAVATAVRPNTSTGGSGGLPDIGVNIYLYQVMPNGAFRNDDLPTRRSDSTVVQKPRAALDLHYILSFYGNENSMEPQRVLGSVVRALHSKPVLTRNQLQNVVNSVPVLIDSDLPSAPELVKFSQLHLTLDELSKLWSVFFQIPYTISIAYHASLVLIEGTVSPGSALPVRNRNVYAFPFRYPVIDRVCSAAGESEPIVADSILRIEGRQLRGENTSVKIGDEAVSPLSVTDTELSVSLTSFSASTLRAGVSGLQVVHELMIGTPETPHKGIESGAGGFVLHPSITKDSGGNYEIELTDVAEVGGKISGTVEVNANPEIGERQRVLLLLNGPAYQYIFDSAPRTVPTGSVEFQVEGVEPGEYLVRIQVDGADSILEYDTVQSLYNRPTMTFVAP